MSSRLYLNLILGKNIGPAAAGPAGPVPAPLYSNTVSHLGLCVKWPLAGIQGFPLQGGVQYAW